MKHLTQWESQSGWAFAYAVKHFMQARERRMLSFTRRGDVIRHFECSELEADLALRLLDNTFEIGRRECDGRYYLLDDETKKRRQKALLDANVA